MLIVAFCVVVVVTVFGFVLIVLLAGADSAVARSDAEMPLVEPTVSEMPSVPKLIVCEPPAAMLASVSVCVAPLLARVSVT